MGPKKLSGSAFKKLRKEKEKTAVLLSGHLKNWLKPNKGECASNSATDQDESNADSKSDDDTETQHEYSKVDDQPQPTTSHHMVPPISVNHFEVEESSSDSSLDDQESYSDIVGCHDLPLLEEEFSPEIGDIVFNDPKQWPGYPCITDKIRIMLVERGPQIIDVSTFKFPVSDEDRHFDGKWFYKPLTNGERVRRQWLLYSQSEDSLFCFPCLLFGKNQCGKSSSFSDINKGFKDWKHLNPQIFNHENSSSHRLCCMSWKDLENRLKQKKTLDAEIQASIHKEAEKWINILQVVIDVIIFCAKNNLPLRGTAKKEIIGEASGVFLSILELISHYHPKLAEHMAHVKSNKMTLSYFAPKIQNELINLIGSNVRQSILNQIKHGKYFSIIFDCTPDSAHIEQMSQVIRFVDLSDGKCQVKESFIDFINTNEKTGEGISEDILKKLNEDGLTIENCRGQGYDNGSNMAGKYNGVQAQILKQNESARFVPCAAHSLNLIGSNAAAVSPLMISFFGTIQKIFTFFSGSTGRWQTVLSNCDITLKGHCDTRWSTKRRAVSALKRTLEELYASLKEMADNNEGKWNLETSMGAQGLIKQIDFKFLCLLHLWERILISIDKINKSLQKETVTVDQASKMIRGLSNTIQEIRDEGICQAMSYAIKQAQEIGVDDNFAQKRRKIVSKRLLDLNVQTHDEYLDSKQEFQREINLVYDQILTELTKRYESMASISSDYYFLTGEALQKEPTAVLLKHSADFGIKYSRDVNVVELSNELEIFQKQVKELIKDLEKATPLDILRKIQELSLEDIYPNIQIALRIYLTLPVTVASCERSFSKLKLIKNYLRSSMGQERLSNLAILSIEHEEVAKLNLDQLIDDFAKIKARKVAFK